jgi:hypothetical protein
MSSCFQTKNIGVITFINIILIFKENGSIHFGNSRIVPMNINRSTSPSHSNGNGSGNGNGYCNGYGHGNGNGDLTSRWCNVFTTGTLF